MHQTWSRLTVATEKYVWITYNRKTPISYFSHGSMDDHHFHNLDPDCKPNGRIGEWEAHSPEMLCKCSSPDWFCSMDDWAFLPASPASSFLSFSWLQLGHSSQSVPFTANIIYCNLNFSCMFARVRVWRAETIVPVDFLCGAHSKKEAHELGI